MQPALAEYRITRLLVETGNSCVYEAVALRDGRACIAKVFDISDETLTARVEHEFELIRGLDIEGVVRAASLQRVGDQLALMLERAPGVDLSTLADGKALPLALFLDIAVQITEILAKTHAQRVVHRDIKPANLLYDTASGRAHIADFGISVLLESERRHIYDARVLVGTLPYISPEQTGRTNRSVDFRSDLYSLGATFYELLTGRRPFENLSPLELIHAHLARMPTPPIELRPELPEPLSRLIMKLLAKAPEQRYQTAAGLASDLRALGQLLELGPIEAPFELGRADLSTSLRLPQQLYGRAREQKEILQRLAEVVTHSDRRTLLLVGPPGVGKSALLGVLDVAAVGYGGYVLRGKFDVSRELPYSAFVEAFTGLLEQLLTESDARLGRWRRTLLAGLGGLVNVACELIPTLSLIVGSIPPAPELGPIQARNRLQLALDSLLTTLAAEAPLVLILDDLQLADQASLALLDSLVRGTTGPLLITASISDAAIDDDHPLALLLSLPQIRVMQVEPLRTDVIALLLRDTLGDLPELGAFAAIVERKSGGMPMFIGSFLTELVAHGQLWVEAGGWRWNPAEVDAAAIPDDAVAFMRSKLARQTDEARELLGYAACLATRFNLAELALASGRAPAEIIETVLALRDEGLLVDVGRDHRFAHDSIQTAAKQLLDPESRQRVHRAIARSLVDTHMAAGTLDERVLEIVEHLIAAGPERELEPTRALELTGLFLRAGQRALDSAAYDLALRYCDLGIARLDELDKSPGVGQGGRGSPRDDKDELTPVPDELAFGLAFGRAQALALAGSHEQANAAFEQLLARPLADAQFGLVVARRLRLLQLDNRQPEAVELGRSALAKLGAPLPNKVSFTRAAICLTRAWLLLRKLELDQAMALPACTDPRGAAIVEIVAQLKYPAFVVDNDLFVYLCGVHVLLLRTHGFHETSPVAFADLSLGVSGGLDKAGDAARMLELALHSCARVRRPEAAKVNILAIGGTMSLHRTRAIAEFLDEFEQHRQIALELGEIDHASFMATLSMEMSLDIGTHLLTVERRVHEQEIDHARRGAQQMQMAAWVIGCVCGSLLGPRSSSEPDKHGHALLLPESVRQRGGIATTQSTAWAGAALVELVLGDREAAARTCRDVQPVIGAVLFNSWIVARLYCIASVTHYARITFDGASAEGQPSWLRKCVKLLRGWAIDCPANYRHQLELVLGMQAAARGRIDDAITQLDRACTNARARGCRWVEGLAAEYIAELLERRGSGVLVEGAWRRAWDAYSAWGAQAKLDKLREAKPELFAEPERRRATSSIGSNCSAGTGRNDNSTRTTGLASHDSSLDLEAVLRSIGFITEELQFEQIVLRLLDAVLTNVGADHGLLLLERDGELALVAEARTGDGHREVLRRPIRLRELGARAPSTIVNLVVRTGKPLVLDDAGSDPRFAGDPYFVRHEVRSLLATPILRDSLLGVLVVENRQGTHGFSPTSVETVRLITGQVASTLDNARLLSALRRSEGRWRSLVDGAPDLIALLDEHADVVFINRGRIDEHGDTEFITAMTERARASWTAAVEQVLAEGLPAELELELERGLELDDGDGPRWFAVRLAPIELGKQDLGDENDGEPRRNAIVVATDISDRKRAEVERAELETQLRQQQRLESLGTLASGIAHEINNPVQGIMNYAELIISSINDHDTAIEFAGEITHEAERVATIVRNLLAFSRQDRDQSLEPTDLETLVNGTMSLLQAVLRKDHIRIDVNVPPLPVRCRVQQIQQIILNLVTNARDALNQHCPDSDERRKIEIRGEPGPGGRVRIIVEDHGPGIPDDVVSHIFDPFFTTKGRDKGTGLGLSVSHGIAKEHGGEILVESRLGEGTRFIVELPA
jgi:predicted ATPase/signal transduction histidine kinase/tRNA A-37 threonylcarbamoyl transferase component Bud32